MRTSQCLKQYIFSELCNICKAAYTAHHACSIAFSPSVPLQVQIKECIDNARDVVKYFKNKTVVHSLLDRARQHVKVSP